MKVLAGITALMSAFSMGFALWDHNSVLALSDFNAMVWAVLYMTHD